MARTAPLLAGALGLLALAVAAAPAPAAQPSAGCGLEAPPSPPATFTVEGRERRAIVAAPDGYRAGRPHKLVVAFHGRTDDNADVRRYFDLEAAAREPAVYVYPAGLPDRQGRFTWADPGDAPGALRDLAFFDAILARVGDAYCIDRDAVFVVGHSLGATFANSVACARGRVVRGLASVAGGIAAADCRGEVAALLVHNPRDELVPIAEGERARDALVAASDAPALVADTAVGGLACRQHGTGASPLLWCLSRADRTAGGRFYPHQWPVGAGALVMRFVEAHAG